MTKRELEKLAKARYGANAFIRHNPKAPDADERQRQRERIAECKAREEMLRAERLELGNTSAKLAVAARFVVDVAAGEPSLSQLAIAVAAEERWKELQQEETELRAERDAIHPHWYRWQLLTNKGLYTTEKYHADTPEELAEKLSAKTELEGVKDAK